MRALVPIVCLAGILFVLLCIPNVRSSFDSNPGSIKNYLGISLPNEAKVVRLAASTSTAMDGSGLHLQAKVKISREDFVKMAEQLGLLHEAGTAVPPENMFQREAPGEWWNPPEPIVQFDLPDSYGKHEITPILSRDIQMIWVDGIAFIYENKFDGRTGYDGPKNDRP